MAEADREEAPLSARLLVLLTRELSALERVCEENSPDDAGEDRRDAGAKGRVEAVALVTRTLEKLLELKRLEALSARGDTDEDAEAARLATEMLRRLRALDARRRGGAVLFAADGRYRGMDEGDAVLAAACHGAPDAAAAGGA
ncbi:hypothetical protein Sa4125_12230 [Aureimonas sp. SA4125]|uniref:hypothetical protein n=1 Tax=Aureimonas sp. SA4125 TaxID=2826993 RepID=UPI001CC49541|nr:hypothetical protein [Aureimonas sp. SA4125]BDA83681.1 hypothetical protein Sa4125_12230 [Aureimonas sp. SA4125]